MRRCLAILVFAASLVHPALAEGAKSAPTAAPGTSVEMPFLIAPLNKDGNLLGYAYISSKLVASSPGAAIAIREKLAFIQDANVRNVNATPIAKDGDPKSVDKAALCKRLADIAKRIVGNTKVVRVEITAMQFAPLHPTGSTNGLMSAPPPGMTDPTGANQIDETSKTPAATSKPAKSATH